MPPRVIIPTTQLRYFYQSFELFDANPVWETAKGINGSKDKKKFIVKMIERSLQHFSIYDNRTEPFLADDNDRIPLPEINPEERFIETRHVIRAIKDANIDNQTEYKIRFIEREIDPRRSRLSMYDFGKEASGSGTGGADFIGWEVNSDLPFIGEVKTRDDTNAFKALIQVLTYFTEFSTPNQIERCNRHNVFGRTLNTDQEFILGIVLADFNTRSKPKLGILEQSKILADYITPKFKQIHSIVFLNMTKPFTDFEIL